MAFTVNPDHERQEQIWEALKRSYTRQPYEIRRMLTEGAVRASDRRANFVGLEAYEAAGGVILRDLFQPDDGGWLQDAGLLERLVVEKLEREAKSVHGEGWKWVATAPDFPYGHTYGMRRLIGEPEPMSDEEAETYRSLEAERTRLEEEHKGSDELPEHVDRRLGEIEAAMEAIEDRPVRFEADDVARAGVFVSIDGSGRLRDRARLCPARGRAPVEADEPVEADTADRTMEPTSTAGRRRGARRRGRRRRRPLPDRLVTKLTAHRTLALRDALAGDPEIAFLAALHALALRLFYRFAPDTCLEIDPRSATFGAQAPGLGDTTSAQAIEARHEAWARALPKATEELWRVLAGFDRERREALFAHCVALTVNAVHEPYNRRPRALAHADMLAAELGLDMAGPGGARPRRATSVASPRLASSKPCARRRARPAPSGSPG